MEKEKFFFSPLFKFMFLAGTMRCNQKIGVYPERKDIYGKNFVSKKEINLHKFQMKGT